MWTWLVVATSLAAWSLVSFALARRAESRATLAIAGRPWLAIYSVTFAAVAALFMRATPAAAAACGFACIGLIVAADADARTGYLFDAVTLPAAILVFIAVAVSGSTNDAAWGVALLVGTFGAIVVFSGGRLMGLGDVKAMFALGAAFGPLESLIAILAASISGIIVASLSGRLKRGEHLRFGPHLAAGSLFALVAGDHIVHRWMGL